MKAGGLASEVQVNTIPACNGFNVRSREEKNTTGSSRLRKNNEISFEKK